MASFFTREKNFLTALTANEHALLAASFFRALAQPFIVTFFAIYLWHGAPNQATLFTYFSSYFLGIMLGFIVNSLAIRSVTPRHMLVFGIFLEGLLPLIFILCGVDISHLVILVGLNVGLAAGLYWANHGYLTSFVIEHTNRTSYVSLETALMAAASIVAPIMVGGWLSLAHWFNLFSLTTSYSLVASINLLVLLLGVYFTLKLTPGQTLRKTWRLFVKKPTKTWHIFRAFVIFDGIVSAIDTSIPFLLILYFFRGEATIGSLSTISAIVGTTMIYLIGRHVSNHLQIFRIWLIISCLTALLISLFFSPWALLVAIFLRSLIAPFTASSISYVVMNAISKQAKNDEQQRAICFLDREVFLNAGRLIVLVPLIYIGSQLPLLVLRVGFFIFILAILAELLLLTKINKALTLS